MIESVSRPKIGLALGSGGPRGIAHIGVLKVLIRAGVPIDYIAGSSMGALIGGLYARDRNIKAAEQLALSTDWKKIASLIDPSIHRGLIKGDKWEQFLRTAIGFTTIKRLQVPLQIVATDFNNGQVVCFKDGDLVEAVRASTSVPILFRPVEYRNRVFVDGGLSMPVPVSIVRRMGADIVIAVNVEGDFFDSQKNVRLTLTNIAGESIKLLRYHLARQEADTANIAITVHSRRGKLIEEVTWNAEDLIAAGERAAKAALPQIFESIS